MRGNVFPERDLVDAVDAAHASACRAQRLLLALIAEVDRSEGWRDDGARDTAHWLVMRYGISYWKAHRWLTAAYALEMLPLIDDALSRGVLGIDKVVELCRLATSETEADLIPWAMTVSCGAIRHRADVAARTPVQEVIDAEETRSLSWWYFDGGRRFALEGELPAAQGAIVARRLERTAREIPVMPDKEGVACMVARRADALVAMCASGNNRDLRPDSATVIVHARLDGLERGAGGARSRTVRPFTRSPCGACCATRACRPWSRIGPGTCSASVAPLASRRPG